MMKLDPIDYKILTWLQEHGRMSNAELAEKVSLSASACLRRVQLLEQNGVIEGYAMLVNQDAIGKGSTIFVEISLNSQSEDNLQAFEQAVIDCPDILECHLMTGDADYLLRVVAADTKDYERIHRKYLARFPAVVKIRTNFALRTIVKRTAIPVGPDIIAQ